MSLEIGDFVRVVKNPKTAIGHDISFINKYAGLFGTVIGEDYDQAYWVRMDDGLPDEIIFAESDLIFVEHQHIEHQNVDKMKVEQDNVISHPSHYTQGIECMDYIESHKFNYARGNVIKYVTRAGLKDESKEIEDLKKARWYLDREISRLEKKDG